MRAREIKGGIAYFWEPPHWARTPHQRNGRPCPATAEPLGLNLADAVRKADQLNEVLDDWRKGGSRPVGATAGTVSWLFSWYRTQEVFTTKKPKTRSDYTKIMDAVCAIPMKHGAFGDRRAGAVTTAAADGVYAHFKPRGPRQAMYVVQVCRAVWNWAGRYSKETGVARNDNPFAGMRKSYAPAQDNRPTSRPEYLRYCETARELGLESMATAAALSFELVQRVSDAFGYAPGGIRDDDDQAEFRGIRWQDYVPGHSIRVFQVKTGRRLTIPLVARLSDGEQVALYPELEEQLARVRPSMPTDQIVIEERTGKPYEERRVSQVHRRICVAAGLPKAMTPTGFRHGGATELGDAGEVDIRSISGHKKLDTTAIYNKASQEKARQIALMRRDHIRRIDPENDDLSE